MSSPSRSADLVFPSVRAAAALFPDAADVSAGADVWAGVPDSVAGTDGSESIVVTVDADCRVIAVDIAVDWRTRLQPGEFGGAVYDAYCDAVRGMLDATVTATLPELRESHPADGGPSGPTGPVPLALEETDAEWSERISATIAATHDDLAQADMIGNRLDTAARRVRTPRGLLVFQFEGPALTGITGDPRPVAVADADRLALEALRGFQAGAQDIDD
jgi:hypothetical protein